MSLMSKSAAASPDSVVGGAPKLPARLPRGLMIGAGEYTTGFVEKGSAASDKKTGVVALCLFDLRARGKVDPTLLLSARSGPKMPAVRKHLQDAIGNVYRGMNVELETFPSDVETDSSAYLKAMDKLEPGDFVTIFTPDDTHYDIAAEAVRRGLHVLVTKPPVQRLEQHRALMRLAAENNVIVAVELHKRLDPMYDDARSRIRQLGPVNYFYSFMSQPKSQLATFASWAGVGSDISYYLNSHHIDFHALLVQGQARPVSVTACAATGVAHGAGLPRGTEDTITLTTSWQQLDGSGNTSIGVYTASWIAPRSDVHSQQLFSCLCARGQVNIDQAHRGYTLATDTTGTLSLNPLFMRLQPGPDGRFVGQLGYGYRSIESFVDAVSAVRAGRMTIAEACSSFNVGTLEQTAVMTAILEAGRISLHERRAVQIVYNDDHDTMPAGYA